LQTQMDNKSLFNLKPLPERTNKPRESGITMVMDKGLSLIEAQSLAETGEHTVDLIKLGFGTSLVTPKLQDKINLYNDVVFQVYLGGTLFEAYIARNQFDDYCRVVEKLKIQNIEVSDGSINLPHQKKCELISTLTKNFKVLSEVGSKDAEKIIPPSQADKNAVNPPAFKCGG